MGLTLGTPLPAVPENNTGGYPQYNGRPRNRSQKLMRHTATSFYVSKDLLFEEVLATPNGLPEPYPTLVVCHPHLTLGDDMEDPVFIAICRAANDNGIASLRFNFRGVGSSQGKFSNGPDEQEDLRSALRNVKVMPGWIAGNWRWWATPSAPL